jgi:hypothetical protein
MPFDPVDAAKKANLIEFAYDMFTPGVLQPKPVSPKIAAAGYEFLYYLNATDFQSREFYGYIAKSTTKAGAYALAIRGTKTLAEWVLDFAAIPVPFSPAPDAGWVALGFLSIYETFEFIDLAGASFTLAEVVAALSAQAGGITEFLVLGHSLGGALSTLASADLTINNLSGVQSKVTSYTFASPLVGLWDFAWSFNDAVPVSYRVWNTLDLVPQLPPFPYIHVSGHGDSIVQTQHQLETLVFSPGCEHSLVSYQWLLDAADFALDAGCTQTATPARVAATAAAVAPGHSPGQHKASAKAMRKAYAGHM